MTTSPKNPNDLPAHEPAAHDPGAHDPGAHDPAVGQTDADTQIEAADADTQVLAADADTLPASTAPAPADPMSELFGAADPVDAAEQNTQDHMKTEPFAAERAAVEQAAARQSEPTMTGPTEPMTNPTAATTPLPPLPSLPSVGSASSSAASDPASRWDHTSASDSTPSGRQAESGSWQEPAGAPAAAGATGGHAASASRKRRPLFGTIVWGVLLLVFAAFMVVWTVTPTSLDPTLWLLGAVIATGILLVVAGIVAAARRAD